MIPVTRTLFLERESGGKFNVASTRKPTIKHAVVVNNALHDVVHPHVNASVFLHYSWGFSLSVSPALPAPSPQIGLHRDLISSPSPIPFLPPSTSPLLLLS